MRGLMALCLFLINSSVAIAAQPSISNSQRILASDGGSNSAFGSQIAMQGDTALISAFFDGPKNSGAVYSFEKDAQGQWREKQKFNVPGLGETAAFGGSVALFGDFAVVGAYQQRPSVDLFGTAYLFQRDASGYWNRLSDLDPGEARHFYGRSVAVGDGIAAVGSASRRQSIRESVYIFSPNSLGEWVRSDKLTLQSPGETRFGQSISLSGDTLLAGAYLDGGRGHHSGAAYIFDQQNANWVETAKLTASDATQDAHFGYSVKVMGEIALVGAPGSNSAYLFKESSPGNWEELAKLTANDALASDRIGGSVALWGDYALVGNNIDVYRNESAGAAYLFKFDHEGNWTQVAKYTSGSGEGGDTFGWDVAMDAGAILIGAAVDGGGAVYGYQMVPEPTASCVYISLLAFAFTFTQRRR